MSLAILGVVAGLVSAYVPASGKKPPPPAFHPAQNPYAHGIFATGIVESYQPNGSNINIFPEVPGTVTKILVSEGARWPKGTPLVQLEDSVQKATVQQQKAQAEAALAMLKELKAQPRPENLRVSKAQVDYAAANLQTARDSLAKVQQSFALNPKSVSKDQLDQALNTFKAAKANLEVARKQYELTKAGAWVYDIQNQQHQYEALTKTYASGMALLAKYTLRAPADGIVLAVNAAVGGFANSTGAYGTYTQGYDPPVVMGLPQDFLAVRTYIDEILVPRMLSPGETRAEMQVRGTATRIPLTFDHIQPYTTPKIELSNQRTERVDVRVLPVLFRFAPPKRALRVFTGHAGGCLCGIEIAWYCWALA